MYGKTKTIRNLAVLILMMGLTGTATAEIIYVDGDATAGGGGTSWVDAFADLQDALAAADPNDEIRVAQGTYKPDQGVEQTPSDRQATFQLKNGAMLKGGYASIGEPDPDARDVELYETILSGDLMGNDISVANPRNLPGEPTRSENSFHVVTGSGANETAVLDGFTITGGNAHVNYVSESDDPNVSGGGMLNILGSPTVVNCTFSSNSTDWYGGGMMNRDGSDPIVTNCRFIENATNEMVTSGGGGGAANGYNSNPTLTSCDFIDNWGTAAGGLGNIFSCDPILKSCTFKENTSKDSGGGIHNYDNCSPKLEHCNFVDNVTGKNGGGMAS